MELHQQARVGNRLGRQAQASRRVQPPFTSSLRPRFAAFVHSSRLEAELAGGADPATDPALARRADRLCDPHNRRQLARGFRGLVERAERPPRRSAVAPLARSSVLACHATMLELAPEQLGDALENALIGLGS